MTPRARRFRDDQRRAAEAGDLFDLLADFLGQLRSLLLEEAGDGVGGALADAGAGQVDAAHAGLRGEGNELGVNAAEVASAEVVLLLGEHDDGAAFGGFVGERGELRGVGHALLADVGGGIELGGLAVAEGDGAGLVEQQRVHVAGGFNGAAAHGQDVVLDEAVHAGDADGREQAADGGGDEADQQRDQHEDRLRRLGVHGEGLQRDDGEQKDDGEAGEQNAERDFVGGLLAGCAFDQGDHAVEEGFAGVGGDADLDPVGEDLCAAGDGGAVAAGFADDGRRLAGDGRLVHRGDAFDDFAVAGDVVAGLDVDHVAQAEQAAGNLFKAAVGLVALGDGLALGLAQGIGLGLAAAFGHGLGKVGEEHREPQPEGDLEVEAEAGAVVDGVVNEQRRGEHAADLDHKHHRVLDHPAGIELAHRVEERLGHDFRVPKTFLFSHDSPFREAGLMTAISCPCSPFS
jgi:hypothetical protein